MIYETVWETENDIYATNHQLYNSFTCQRSTEFWIAEKNK